MGLFSKGLSQKDKYLAQANSAINLMNFYDKELKGNISIEQCTNMISSLTVVFEELYKITPFIKNEFDIQPDNIEDFKKLYGNKLRSIVYDKKQEILEKYNKTGQLRYYSQLVNLNDEIINSKKLFPEFIEYLDNDDLEKIISEGEK